MSYIKTTFLGAEYTIPADILLYIDLLDFTSKIKAQLTNTFVRKLKDELQKGNVACVSDEDLAPEIERQVGLFIAKLTEKDIYDRTVNDYLRQNEGYKLISKVNAAALEEARRALKQQMSDWLEGYEGAMQKKDASVSGLGFSIWSSSFVNHAIYAAMEASKVNEQEKAAVKEYQKDMAELRTRLENRKNTDEQRYVANTYIPNMEAAITVFSYELLDTFISDLIKYGKLNKEVLNYTHIDRSNDLLKNLELSQNKPAVLLKAFEACPYNIAVYMQAMKHDLLDYTTFQTAKIFGHGNMIIAFLEKNLGGSAKSEKKRLNFKNAELLSLYSGRSLREITAYMADFIVDGYAQIVAALSNTTPCYNIMNQVDEEDILAGNNISKEKAKWLVDPLAPAVLWDKLTVEYGHDNLFDRLLDLLPGETVFQSKKEYDFFLKKKLFAVLETIRQERVEIILAQRQEDERRKEAEAENARRTAARNKAVKKIGVVATIVLVAIVIASIVINKISNAKAYQEMSGTYLVHSVVHKDGDPYYDYNWWLDIAEDGSFEMASYSYVYEGTQVEQILGVIKANTSISAIDDFVLDTTAYDNANYCYEIKFDDGDRGYIVGWTNEDIRQVEIFCGNSRYAFSETSPNHTFPAWSKELTSIVELFDIKGNKSNKISDWTSFDVVLLWGHVPSSWQVSFNSEEEEGFPTEGSAKNVVNGNVVEELRVSYMGKYENFLGFFANHKYADLFDEIKLDSKSKSYAMIDVDENRNIIVDWYLLRGGRMYHVTYSVPMENYDEGKMMEILYEVLC